MGMALGTSLRMKMHKLLAGTLTVIAAGLLIWLGHPVKRAFPGPRVWCGLGNATSPGRRP